MAEFNIIGPKFDSSCDWSLFGEDDVVTPLVTTDTSMAHLLARIGKFSSVGEGKRNGWDKPIPNGWNHFIIGKGAKRWDIYIWNPTHTLQEFIDEYGVDK